MNLYTVHKKTKEENVNEKKGDSQAAIGEEESHIHVSLKLEMRTISSLEYAEVD